MVLTLTTELVDTVKMCTQKKRLAGHYIRSQPLVNGEKYWQCTYKKSCFTLVVITDIPVNEVTEKRIAGGLEQGGGVRKKKGLLIGCVTCAKLQILTCFFLLRYSQKIYLNCLIQREKMTTHFVHRDHDKVDSIVTAHCT